MPIKLFNNEDYDHMCSCYSIYVGNYYNLENGKCEDSICNDRYIYVEKSALLWLMNL